MSPDATTVDDQSATRRGCAHPLGPVILRYASVTRSATRRRALIVAACCAVILAVACWLEPNPAGLGTHRQLGLYRCTWPTMLGIPCPTCGMTTAYALLVRGRLFAAFDVQPFGLLLALCTVIVLVLSLREAWTLRVWRVNWYRIPPSRVGIALAVLALAGWGYKILAFRAGMG